MYAMIPTLPSKENLFLMFIYLFIFKLGLNYLANDQSVIVCFLFTVYVCIVIFPKQHNIKLPSKRVGLLLIYNCINILLKKSTFYYENV